MPIGTGKLSIQQAKIRFLMPTSTYSTYSTILFMDSMVALEGKPLADQPWAEIDPVGPILVLVVPQVSTEIDKRKRDGRLGNRARAFNRLIRPAATSGKLHRIFQGPPAVDIGISIVDRIDWDALDDLDPDDPDAHVVAQILNARGVPQDRKLLLSQDINPISMATRHNLKAFHLPDHWLLEPEPSPNEKAITRLKARVAELEASEPDLQFDVEFPSKLPLILYRVRPMPKDRWSELASSVISQNPKQSNGGNGPFRSVTGYDPDYDDKYERYKDVLIYRYITTLHKNVEIWFGQVPFKLTLKNVGHVQAENLILSLRASEGRLHDKFASYPIWGPQAPKPQPYNILNQLNTIQSHIRPAIAMGRHEMNFAHEPDRTSNIEVHCQDFRHGYEWVFEGVATINPYCPNPFVIAVCASASNMKGLRTRSFEQAYAAEEVDVINLIDPFKQERLRDLPIEDNLQKAIKERNFDWLQMLCFEKNWSEISGESSDNEDGDN